MGTLIRRLGNKARVADNLLPYFPKHTIYIELFFGGGGMFFNKPRAKYNYLNDKDDNVYNVFQALRTQKQALYDYIESVPYCQTTFNYIKTNRNEFSEFEKVGNFLILSAWSYLGKMDMLRFSNTNSKQILLQNIEKTYQSLLKNENQFMNYDFRDVFSKISLSHSKREYEPTFIYADPPYLDTANNYEAGEWTENDTFDLLKMCKESPCKFAISEFKHDLVVQTAKDLNLNVFEIKERRSLKNRSTEILITNYNNNQNLF